MPLTVTYNRTNWFRSNVLWGMVRDLGRVSPSFSNQLPIYSQTAQWLTVWRMPVRVDRAVIHQPKQRILIQSMYIHCCCYNIKQNFIFIFTINIYQHVFLICYYYYYFDLFPFFTMLILLLFIPIILQLKVMDYFIEYYFSIYILL